MKPEGAELAVLSVGEAMVELSASATPDLWHLGFAGDTLNTAWYLRRLLPPEQAVGYLTRVGQGGFSRRMVDFIAGAGIVNDHIGTDPAREVGLYAIDLDRGERSFTYWRSASAARGLADDAGELSRAFARARVIYLSGITTAILPPEGRETLALALAQARDRSSSRQAAGRFITAARRRAASRGWNAPPPWTPRRRATASTRAILRQGFRAEASRRPSARAMPSPCG